MFFRMLSMLVPTTLGLFGLEPASNPGQTTAVVLDDCGCSLQAWSTGNFTNGRFVEFTDLGLSAGVEISIGASAVLSENRCDSECVPSGAGCGAFVTCNITDFGSLPGGKICVPLASPAFFPLCTTSSVGSLYECCRSGQDTGGLGRHLETGCGGSLYGNAQLSAEIDENGFQPLVADLAFGFDCTPCVATPN